MIRRSAALVSGPLRCRARTQLRLVRALSAITDPDAYDTTPTPAPAVTYTVTGTVKSSAGVALNGANVRVSDGPNAGQSAFTNSSGSYAISGLSLAGFTVIASQPGFISIGQGAKLTSGVTTSTLNFTLAPAGPSTSFGNGQYTVGGNVAAGRYFTDPPYGCYWERESGFGGTLSEIIANDFVGFDARQLIVDILASDKGFKSDGCGAWTLTPRPGPAAGSIQPGMWLVGSQNRTRHLPYQRRSRVLLGEAERFSRRAQQHQREQLLVRRRPLGRDDFSWRRRLQFGRRLWHVVDGGRLGEHAQRTAADRRTGRGNASRGSHEMAIGTLAQTLRNDFFPEGQRFLTLKPVGREDAPVSRSTSCSNRSEISSASPQ